MMHISIRVELYRAMAAAHPVQTLLSHHLAVDIGLEMLLATVLLSPNTPKDQTFGLGATGATRYLDYLLRTSVSIANDLPTDLANRGLTGIPNYKYALSGTKLFTAISKFVTSYVGAYNASDKAVVADFELQNWAVACAKVPHLKDFPSKIQTKACLSKLLTHLVFQSAVKHHAMNGATTWHMLAVPYSPGALWKKLPAKKVAFGQTLDLMEYVVPVVKMHVAIGLAAMFYFPPPASETLAKADRKTPFTNETCIQPAIAQFEKSLAEIDDFIVKKEDGEANPYKILRPSLLPFDSWA